MALKRIRYVGRNDAVTIEWPLPGGVTTVEHGGHVDLPTRLADTFLEQEDNWEAVAAAPTKKGDD